MLLISCVIVYKIKIDNENSNKSNEKKLTLNMTMINEIRFNIVTKKNMH